MSINIKIIQRKDKASKSNTAPIHIRFTLKGKVRYLATGVVLPLGAWNDTEQHIIPSYPDSEVLQMQITAKRLEIEKKIQRLEALDTEVSFDTLFGQKSRYINCTVSEYFQQQIDYLKNDKLQMLFASEDKIYLLDRLGRKVGRFPISLGKRILLGPDVYDFSGDRDYTLMVLHEDNTLMQYGLDGKPVPGWNVISLNEKIMSLPERIVVGGRTYWAVRTSYQTLLYDAHGTICADFSKKNKLRKDTEIETVSSHEAGVTMADGRAMILNLSDGSFRKR